MSLKIKKHTIKEDRQKFETNNPGRPDFVYHVDKFKDLAEVAAEIQRSIDAEKKRKIKIKKKLDKIIKDLEG